MKRNSAFLVATLFFTICACNDDAIDKKDYLQGKNYYTIDIDGDEREYYVHVPSTYEESTSVPIVLMLHGTSGDGLRFYNNSGWKEVGESENIITVFPSSWKYCVIDDGQVKNTTKWNVYPGSFEYCDGEDPRDDVDFFRQIISELKQRFNVDSRRFYLAGFSNGGAMAFRCAVELSDIFAAIVESGGTYSHDSIFNPVKKIPITFQLGNQDDKWLIGNLTYYPIELFEKALDTLPVFKRIVDAHIRNFNLSPTNSISGNEETALIATYPGASPSPKREFRFILVNGLKHNYPNGKNHNLNGAVHDWEWMKQFSN